jgi:tRNA(Ile)-lysidine synthase TilS/MesJ
LFSSIVTKEKSLFFTTNAVIPEGENLEAAARRARYDFFNQIVCDEGYDYAITAHSASDVVETYLMRVLSNKEPRSITACDEDRKLLRPMLTLFRERIVEYAKAKDVPFNDDESNFDQRFLRNRVRHSLLPFLSAEYNPNIEKLLFERASAAAADIQTLESIAEQHLRALDGYVFGSKVWRRAFCEILLDLPDAMAWRLVELTLYPKLRFNLGRQHSARALAVIKGEVVAADLPGSVRITRMPTTTSTYGKSTAYSVAN